MNDEMPELEIGDVISTRKKIPNAYYDDDGELKVSKGLFDEGSVTTVVASDGSTVHVQCVLSDYCFMFPYASIAECATIHRNDKPVWPKPKPSAEERLVNLLVDSVLCQDICPRMRERMAGQAREYFTITPKADKPGGSQ